ncbi:hypothetical protein CK203_034097 [Vitis vinifera]|uniref:Uncharacterized protein n=1 Tax=Vitis vinifera TaxID=29760 RepID=A0A438IB75_VITVI|nr:hypothetical protein CK203_034097 [Vitis vinifera]
MLKEECRSFREVVVEISREGSALWHQVILSIYGSHSNGWDVNNIVRWSHRCPWKAIALVYQEFSEFTRFVVGLFTVKSFFLALSNILSRLQFSLPSLSGMLKSLSKSSPLSSWWLTRRIDCRDFIVKCVFLLSTTVLHFQ